MSAGSTLGDAVKARAEAQAAQAAAVKAAALAEQQARDLRPTTIPTTETEEPDDRT